MTLKVTIKIDECYCQFGDSDPEEASAYQLGSLIGYAVLAVQSHLVGQPFDVLSTAIGNLREHIHPEDEDDIHLEKFFIAALEYDQARLKQQAEAQEVPQ